MTKVAKTSKALSDAEMEKVRQENHKLEAKILHMPSTINAVVSERYGQSLFPDVSLPELVTLLKESITAVQGGDMKGMEAMLVAQAHALQTMFASVARRAQGQEHLKQYAAHMNLALKAQAQCRATVQALVELKYPRQVIITQQANIANQQQVNNDSQAGQAGNAMKTIDAPAKKNQTRKNELLEHSQGSRLENTLMRAPRRSKTPITK